jgi:uncharacterized protein YceK
MRRPGPLRQQGFGLLAFAMLLAIIAFSLVVGYAGVLTRTEANQYSAKRGKYLDETVHALTEKWSASQAYALDNPTSSITGDTVLETLLLDRK